MEAIALLAIPWGQSDRESLKSPDASASYTLSSKSDEVSVSGWSSRSSGGKAGSISGNDHVSVGRGSPRPIAGRQSRNLDSDDNHEALLKRGRFGEEYGDLINRAGTTRSNEQERASGNSGGDALSIRTGRGSRRLRKVKSSILP